MKINRKTLIAIILILCAGGSAGADSGFRCGTKLVGIRDTRDEVIQICGEPTDVDSWEEERIQRDFGTYEDYDPRTGRDERSREPLLVKVHVNIELWTYDLGPTQFKRYVRFENGIVTKITTGGKGNAQ